MEKSRSYIVVSFLDFLFIAKSILDKNYLNIPGAKESVNINGSAENLDL